MEVHPPGIIIGIAIGFAVSFFLILPARIQHAEEAAQEEIKNFGTQLAATNLTINELEKKNSDQEDKIRMLTENLNAYAGTEGTLASMENLLKAAAIYLDNQENFLEVADYITNVDESAFNEDTSENFKNLYFALKNAIGVQVCESYYTEGNTAFNNKQYDDAAAYVGFMSDMSVRGGPPFWGGEISSSIRIFDDEKGYSGLETFGIKKHKPTVVVTLEYTAEKDIFRLPFLSEHSLTRTATYQWEDGMEGF